MKESIIKVVEITKHKESIIVPLGQVLDIFIAAEDNSTWLVYEGMADSSKKKVLDIMCVNLDDGVKFDRILGAGDIYTGKVSEAYTYSGVGQIKEQPVLVYTYIHGE